MNITISNEDLFQLNKLLVLKDNKIEELERILNLHREVCDRVNGIVSKSNRANTQFDFNNAYLTIKYDLLDQENKNLKQKIKHLEEDFPE